MIWLLFACQEEQNLIFESESFAEEQQITLLYSNALVGEIEPCG